ncbi:MAG: ATP-dependent helicase [Deltaproteobacteria bacterium]|nr:ATP-dependent helicase [Deltaproteobacteria bacterium]
MDGFMDVDIIAGLDDNQRRAVSSGSRHILIVAGPGSGKTRVLASRFARLLKDGASPASLLAITFTNRAASEMKARITGLSPNRLKLDIGTFHSFCFKFLKKTMPGFILFGRAEQAEALRGLGVKAVDRTIDGISAFKNGMVPDAEISGILPGYEEALKKAGALDLDDLLLKTIEALDTGGYGLVKTHIMIDEFQDINPVQSRLVKLLGKNASVLAIGDPDQAIYSFRGGSLKSFMDFEKDYPGCEVIGLNRNYRSLSAVVSASQAVISNNQERIRNDISFTAEGGRIEILKCADEKAEGEFIVKEIERMMGGLSSLTAGDHHEGMRFSDFAVLYRTNRQADALKEAFSRAPIPIHIVEPPGPDFADFIRHLKSKEVPSGSGIPEFIRAEGDSLGLDKELIDLFLMAANGLGEGEDLSDLLDDMTLIQPTDNLDIKADKVNLMTLHMAKGLEFRVVFMAGAEDEFMPLRLKGGSDVEEERRLFYVGMTRAKEILYLIHAKERRVWGEDKERQPSPFVEEIPEGLAKKVTKEKKAVKKRPVQTGLFE